MKIILFHGTRGDVDSIFEKGLLAGGLDRTCTDPLSEKYVVNKERTLMRVLAEFGLTKEGVPEWCYKHELEYEAGKKLHIHFCTSFENARGYAFMGGEPAYLIRYHIMSWLGSKWLGEEGTCLHALDREAADWARREAAQINGDQMYVVAVEIDTDDPRLEAEGGELILRLQGLIEEGKISEDIWENSTEIRYFGDIAPENILSIIKVKEDDQCLL